MSNPARDTAWKPTKKNDGIGLLDGEMEGDGCRYQKKEYVEICNHFSLPQRYPRGIVRTCPKKCGPPTMVPRCPHRLGLVAFRLLDLSCGKNEACGRHGAVSLTTPGEVPRHVLPSRFGTGLRLRRIRKEAIRRWGNERSRRMTMTERRRRDSLRCRTRTGSGPEPLERG